MDDDSNLHLTIPLMGRANPASRLADGTLQKFTVDSQVEDEFENLAPLLQ